MSKLPEYFNKAYDASEHEEKIYKKWEQSGYFNPDNAIADGLIDSKAPTFSIVLPPPNVTGVLHMGSSLMVTIEDTIVRFKRMQGYNTTWIPGTDHAAIATESKVTKLLEKKKIRKREIGREAFLDHVNDFISESQSNILEQFKGLGASLDWSRQAFTLDAPRQRSVHAAFKKLYDLGLIYRGHRIVNWDPKGQTTISDDEIVRKEETTNFYYFQYGPFVIGTARPETKFADKYVVMHPDDKRYAQYKHGQKLTIEWINGPIETTILKDEAADPSMGSGVMTITPWHSQVDFELAQKYDLEKEQIIDKYGKLLPIAGEFAGLKISQAREQIVDKLKDKGLLVKIETDYTHQLATAERTGATVEPQIMHQWFIDVNKKFVLEESHIEGVTSGQLCSLKELMTHVVKTKQVNIMPERFEKNYFSWIDNLRDWCISRQIWFGHQIPVWYDNDDNPHLPTQHEVYFVRHGQSQANKDKVYAGQLDVPLTDEGKKQALAAGQKLSDKNITTIITSDLIRASDTAHIIAKELDIDRKKIISTPLLREVDNPQLNNAPLDKNEEKSGLIHALQDKEGEGLEVLVNRSKQAIKLIDQYISAGEKVLVVGHASFTSCLFSVHNDNVSKFRLIQDRLRFNFKNTDIKTKTFFTNPAGDDLRRDPDTLDTWFSSGLWTFSTLGWPDKTLDLSKYHPTALIESGYDIIFFWIARMILMSTSLLGSVPFKDAYFHGLVRDSQGRKISKSLGNNIDPRDMSAKYGTDAVRMSLLVGTGPGQDSNFDENKVKAYKKFANKIWNASRFALMNLQDYQPETKIDLAPNHQKHLDLLDKTIASVTHDMQKYRLHTAAETLYHFFWHHFADIVIEEFKHDLTGDDPTKKSQAQQLFYTYLKTLLHLLHPFMPFITEVIWAELPQKTDSKPLFVSSWPNAS